MLSVYFQEDGLTLSPEGHALLARVGRGIAQVRTGLPIRIQGQAPDDVLWAVSVEFFAPLAADGGSSRGWAIAMSGRRFRALGLEAPPGTEDAEAFLLKIAPGAPEAVFGVLGDPTYRSGPSCPLAPFLEDVRGVAADSAALGAVRLAKAARLLPTVAVVAEPPVVPGLLADPSQDGFPVIRAEDMAVHPSVQAESLACVGEARVPLFDAENTRVKAFRPADGGLEHLAIVIGTLETDKPVLVRLHSECLTGDLLGSLRCDCGQQLRGAMRTMDQEGAGVVLYLAQEGRGIGLVNKLRAYRLQDEGLDTLDANEQLGFEDDERLYLPAAVMLRALGIRSVRLLTNNPLKVDALRAHGVDVVERVPHAFAPNPHNRAYLETKAKRGGHLL
ncbi:GTP cyclohydrolase II [Phaeovibrio sulfidiphilus]|uniref:GTP cyclohydrolase-2 n=1 Tax=Phaeovibrio sulfidiphilus TaxID=1220600 RepID=A0A8J7CVQ3_9PROT|nr:GTP cyclohydrolase II [Phaeovibrio sulfidiphilus]MBE1236571.1 GTP cyclohydrolase II [Phaeovibrio sulfidiphilus]